MPGFASYDDLIQEMTVNGKQLTWDFYKTGPTAHGAGVWTSLWSAAGSPSAGATINASPGQTFVDMSGSINFPDVSPDIASMVTFGAAATTNCSLQIVDRLCGVGQIALSVGGASARTVNTPPVPRYLSSSYVEAWVEVTTATATTVTVMSMSYVDETGAQWKGSPLTFPAATTVATSMFKLPTVSGSKGVQGVGALNLSAVPSAGVAAVYLQRPLATIPLIANVWNERDLVLQLAALPRCYDGGSLCLQYLASATTATNFWGTVRLAYG